MEVETLIPLLEQAEDMKLKGQHEDAIRFCQQIIFDNIDCHELYEEIGDNYISLGEHKKAKIALNHALKLNVQSANANYLLGFTYSAEQNWKESIYYLEKSNITRPNHPEILRCLGWAIFNSGYKKKGICVLERALVIAPEDSYVLCDLGVCYLNQRNFPRALQLFKKTLDLDPSNMKAKECMRIAKLFASETGKRA